MRKSSVPSWTAVATLTTATAATAATATPAATIPAASAATARPLFASPGNINSEIPPVEARAVHGTDCFLGFFFGAHGDESESARPAALAIGHQVGFEDGAVRGESVLKIVFGGVEGEISDKQFIIHSMKLISFLESPLPSEGVPVSGLEPSLNVAHSTIYHGSKVMSNPTISTIDPFGEDRKNLLGGVRINLSLQRNGL
jgi:hypothetical protein